MGTVLLARRGAPAGATSRDSLEVCFWRREQQVCSGGRLEEYWCYYCCVGSGCEVLGCEWRVVGTC